MSKDILTNKDLQINSQTKFLSNKPWKKHIIQTKTPKRKYVPKIIARKSLQRNPYRKSQNSNSCPTKFWRETSSNKYLKRKFFTKNFLKRNHCQKICDKVLCQRISKETFPAKSLERGISTKKNQNIFGKISLTISLPRTLWRDTYTKHISAETSTEKYWNKKIYHKLPEGKSPQKKSKGPPTKKKSQEKIYKTNNSRKISQAMSKETFTNKAPHKNVPTKISIKSSCSNKTLKRK